MYSVIVLSIFSIFIVKINSAVIAITPNQSTDIDASINLNEHLLDIAKLDTTPLVETIQKNNPDQFEATNINENVDLKSEASTYYGRYRAPIYVPYGYPYNYNAWYRENYYNKPYYYNPYGAPYGGFNRRHYDYYPGQYIYNNPYRRQYSSYYY